MTRHVLGRLANSVVVLVVASMVVFGLLFLAPGDPASLLAGPDASVETVEAIRSDMGLDRPLPVQYLDWAGSALRGDLGVSYRLQLPVQEIIGQRIGSTVQLTLAASFLVIVFGTGMGTILATTKSTMLRRIIDGISTVSLALPPFVSGFLLIFFFAVVWPVFPTGGTASLLTDPLDALQHVILPSIAMALTAAPVVARLLATEMRRTRDQEFILTAAAKGTDERRITWRHVVPNSVGPPIIELSVRIGHLLGGAVVAEAIFTRAGLGSLLVEAVQTRDYPLAQALLLLAISAVIVVQLIAELVMARIDARIRLGGAA